MSSYWEQRAADSIGRMEKSVNGQIPDLVDAFEQARRDINDTVFRFYARYAKNNKITLDEAQKALSLAELRDFRGDLKEFEKLAKKSIGTFSLEVDNLSVKARVTRYEALLTQCDAVLQKLYQEQKKQIEGVAADVYTSEYYHRLFEIEQYTGFKFNYSVPGSAAIRKVIEQPVFGMDISTRLWRQDFDTGMTIRQTLANMFVTGRPPQTFADELQKAIGAVRINPDGTPGGTGKKYEAYRLLYNESAHAVNQAQLQAYRDDGLDEFEDIVTLDKNTCDTCASYDGKHYPVDKAVEGENHPSFHVNCRCTTAPYIPETADLTGSRISRDPVTGKSVPTSARTYEEWKAEQDKKYGAGTVNLERKKAQNEAADFKQYQRYKSTLKNNSPQTFAEFQNLKYNSSEKWNGLKQAVADQRIRNDIKAGKYPVKINPDKQARHLHGDGYIAGRSYFTGSLSEVQTLVDKYAATGKLIKRGGALQEVIHTDRVIGYVFDPVEQKLYPVTDFKIHYSKTGTHAVPYREAKK
ncbi:hypothetical protein A7X67_08235 [Clostridium sp. W14A]|nr:hypothetical protein A7X67_08235 [Clostridium sp. W14A]